MWRHHDVCSCSVRYYCQILTKIGNWRQIFVKFQIQSFIKIRPAGVAVFTTTKTQMDRHDGARICLSLYFLVKASEDSAVKFFRILYNAPFTTAVEWVKKWPHSTTLPFISSAFLCIFNYFRFIYFLTILNTYFFHNLFQQHSIKNLDSVFHFL
jgi:hypothetical protein